jgi:hypothetical protein
LTYNLWNEAFNHYAGPWQELDEKVRNFEQDKAPKLRKREQEDHRRLQLEEEIVRQRRAHQLLLREIGQLQAEEAVCTYIHLLCRDTYFDSLEPRR